MVTITKHNMHAAYDQIHLIYYTNYLYIRLITNHICIAYVTGIIFKFQDVLILLIGHAKYNLFEKVARICI